MIVGIDEAGRGPLAGSVVASALALKRRFPFPVKDSKGLSVKKREQLFSWIINNSYYAVASAGREEIERLNILNATYLAAERAVEKLLGKYPDLEKSRFIVDGNRFKTKLAIKYECREKADEKIPEVACASIVAKVTRDYMMKVIDFLYPQWNFARHKGYPTREHYLLIDRYKLSPFHRRSFLRG